MVDDNVISFVAVEHHRCSSKDSLNPFPFFRSALRSFFFLTWFTVSLIRAAEVRISAEVFYDRNLSGHRDDGEWGVGGVRVQAKGKSCVTDSLGACDLIFSWDPPRMDSLSVEFVSVSIPPGARFTTDRVFEFVSAGGMKRVAAGVYYDEKRVYAACPGSLRLRVVSYFTCDELRLSGNLQENSFLVNNRKISLPSLECVFQGPEVVQKTRSRFVFNVKTHGKMPAVRRWKFTIHSEDGETVMEQTGHGKLPPLIHWDGRDRFSRPLMGNSVYIYRLIVSYSDFYEVWTSPGYLRVAMKTLLSGELSKYDLRGEAPALLKIRAMKRILKDNPGAEVVLAGGVQEIKSFERIIQRYLPISKGKVFTHQTPGGLRIKVMSTPSRPASISQQKLVIDGVSYYPFDDGSYDFFLRDVPLHRNLKVDLNFPQGMRVIANIAVPESKVLGMFNFRKVDREFSDVSAGGQFRFVYSVAGAYPEGYRLLNEDGTMVKSDESRIRLPASIGHSSFPFKLESPSGSSTRLHYVVHSSAAQSDSSKPFLMLSFPLNYRENEKRYLFFRGMTGPHNEIFINGKRLKVREDGTFSHVSYRRRYKNDLSFLIKFPDGKKFRYRNTTILKKADFTEKLRLRAGANTGFMKLSQSEDTVFDGYSRSFGLIELNASIYPFLPLSSRVRPFWDHLAIDVRYERSFLPVKITDSDRNQSEVVSGPEWAGAALMFDFSSFVFPVQFLLKSGVRYYSHGFADPGFFSSVDFGSRAFLGMEAGYRESFSGRDLGVVLALDYLIPSGRKSGFETDLGVSARLAGNVRIAGGFRYRTYQRSESVFRVKESFKGLYVGLNLFY